MKKTILKNLTLALIVTVITSSAISLGSEGLPPIAEAGSSRYAAQDPIVLDGTGSYDPDDSGPLSYTWRQTAGPSLVINDANSATPTINGFIQTDVIQECEFELVVSDGELTSLPNAVKVIIVPDFGADTLRLENPPFDPKKPTVIYFGGGDCVIGFSGQGWNASVWNSRANVISFPNGYGPDSGGGTRTYYKYGDMIIVYLSAVAPDYRQPIQTIGWSTGGQPAIDAGIRLNSLYQDARYAVNRVTQMDAPCRVDPQWGGSWQLYIQIAESFLSSSVDGEQCWLDFYYGTGGLQYEPLQFRYLLTTYLGLGHDPVRNWYRNSLTGSSMNDFNSGVVSGAFWSIIGTGKNLQLAPETDAYYFRWSGGEQSGKMNFYNEPRYPGRLPEPVTLIGPRNGSFVDSNGAIFSCEASENAIGYQLLFGPDPDRATDYYIVSDTPNPPTEVISSSAFEQTWWTVKVYDQYGSTIYADPIQVNFENLDPPLIENITTGQRYASVRHAIYDARNGHEIVVSPGVYKGNINFRGKNLTLRSTDPNDSAVVAATILTGDGNNNLITFSNNEDVNCVLAGFTITDANIGIYGFGSSPTITKCSIVGNAGAGIELYMASSPTISNCIISGNAGSGIAMFNLTAGRKKFINYPTIVNSTIVGNSEIGISEGTPTVLNSIIHSNGVQIAGASAVVTYSNVQGGFPGEGHIDADPLFVYAANGDFHLLTGSPCIDAGDPGTPVGSEPLPNGGRINMGAYGGTPQASLSQ